MRLAIIGAGNVGGTLGTAWAQKAGHEIYFGVRNPTSGQTQAVVRRLGGKAQAGTPAQAAAFAEFIVLTTPWNAAEAAIRSMGDLSGKIILDVRRTRSPWGRMGSLLKLVTAYPPARWCRPGPKVPQYSRR
jgi:predicted dinucleotide-binding enzyme